MKSPLILAGVLLALPNLAAPVPLSDGHTDVGLAYENQAWDLHVHNETNDTEYSPGEALLRLDLNTLKSVPAAPSYSFLGAAGSPVYLLPAVHEDGRLFLGIGAEEMAQADWAGTIQLQLKAVSGPGNFYLWESDTFGNPVVRMNSSDATGGGIGADDAIEIVPGSHKHANWAFSAPGRYTVSFEASGTHAVDGFTASGVVDYHFDVVPEPGSVVLGVIGCAALLPFIRRAARSSARAGTHPAAESSGPTTEQ